VAGPEYCSRAKATLTEPNQRRSDGCHGLSLADADFRKRLNTDDGMRARGSNSCRILLVTERSFCNESPEYSVLESVLCTSRTRTTEGRNVRSIRATRTMTRAANYVRPGRDVRIESPRQGTSVNRLNAR
jgi:hypothetical protein